MSSSSQDARFEAARAIGDFATRDLGQQNQTMFTSLSECQQIAGKKLPRRQNVLAGAREADLTRLFSVKSSGIRGSRADQIISQQSGPQFTPNHVRRLTSDMAEIQI